jgi:UPF0755 protein
MRRLGLLALLAIAALGAGAGWLDSQIDRPYRGPGPQKVFVDIPHGTSRWGVARSLRTNDVVRNDVAFAVFSYWHFRHPLQAGEYLFEKPLNSREVFWKIARGQIFVHIVTVPEGWTMYDIANDLDRQGICPRADFLEAASDTSLISDLSPQARTLEGYLFPATYQFTRRTTCHQIVQTMVTRFRAVYGRITESLGTQGIPAGLSAPQALVLASLVERETPQATERPLVAGVFYNRLRLNYPLQCDPTVQYALVMKGDPVKDVHPRDLLVDSPYNTYEHRGLPPGPIANPGEASIRAALDPTKTDDLYFVANAQGGHFFSRTLAEHNQNVAKLRRLLNIAPASSAHQTPVE